MAIGRCLLWRFGYNFKIIYFLICKSCTVVSGLYSQIVRHFALYSNFSDASLDRHLDKYSFYIIVRNAQRIQVFFFNGGKKSLPSVTLSF